MALVRSQVPRALADAPLLIPAQWFGELGAATGPAAVCMAAQAYARGYGPASVGLVWLADDSGARGAFAVSAPSPAGARRTEP